MTPPANDVLVFRGCEATQQWPDRWGQADLRISETDSTRPKANVRVSGSTRPT